MAINPVEFAEQYKIWEVQQQHKDTSPAAYAAELEAGFAIKQVEALKRLSGTDRDYATFAFEVEKILDAEYGDTWVETYLLPPVPDVMRPESPAEVADDPDYTLD